MDPAARNPDCCSVPGWAGSVGKKVESEMICGWILFLAIFNWFVNSPNLLPVICLLSTKADQNDSESSLHPWWPCWYPEVGLTRSYSLLASDFLQIFLFLLCDCPACPTKHHENWLNLSSCCPLPVCGLTLISPLFHGLRWNCCLMTGHLLVRKQRSKPDSAFDMAKHSPQTRKETHCAHHLLLENKYHLLHEEWFRINIITAVKMYELKQG